MVILWVNDWCFLPALDTFGKKRRPRRRGLSPALRACHGSSPLSPTARSDQSLSPSANCSRSRFVVACFRFGTILLVILIAVLQLQSGCGSSSRVKGESLLEPWARLEETCDPSESDELRSRQAASVWSAFFPVGTEMGKYHSKNVGSENLFF